MQGFRLECRIQGLGLTVQGGAGDQGLFEGCVQECVAAARSPTKASGEMIKTEPPGG